jgi:hypothetical protein
MAMVCGPLLASIVKVKGRGTCERPAGQRLHEGYLHSLEEDDMTEERRGLTDEELAEETGSDLPDREAMSLVDANVAVPVNAAVGANVLSDHSTADPTAAQNDPITQSNI